MGVLANHVPSIEQLKPGVVEIVEESGGAKQWFRMFLSIAYRDRCMMLLHERPLAVLDDELSLTHIWQLLADSLRSSPTPP